MTVNIGSADFLAILPQIVLTLFGLYLLVQAVVTPRLDRRVIAYLGMLGIGIAMITNLFLLNKEYLAFYDMVRVDRLTVVLNFVFLTTAGLSLLMSTSYSRYVHVDFTEFTPLMLFSTVGMMFMGSAAHLMVIFLGLETMSIALYIMAGYRRDNSFSLEASLKYFLLGAFATGFLLYGIALIYGMVGSASLARITEYFVQNALSTNLVALAGLAFLIVGFGFKVALVPFHMWTPDVYQGAPIPVTSFMAVGAKAAGFAAILRVITQSSFAISFQWIDVLWFLAVLTMTVGNIIALVQDDIKRLLAYSSIAHAGYILVGVVAANDLTVPAVMFYLVVYLLMNTGAFAVAALVAGKEEKGTQISAYHGLAKTQPLLALAMAICMFSLAGFPPTAGFMGKFYLFSAAMQSGFVWLVIIGVINSLISVYYYLRVVVAMYMYEPGEEPTVHPILSGLGVVILFTILGVLYFGLFPGSLMGIAY